MAKKRNPFEKLLANCKLNGIYQKQDGTWAINSSTNKRRMEGKGSAVGSSMGKKWVPSKILITVEDLENQWKKQGCKCYWFNIPLDFQLLYKDHPEWFPKHPMAPSVDRVDDKLDYTPDNIVISCRFANLGRNVYPHDKMRDVLNLIFENNKLTS